MKTCTMCGEEKDNSEYVKHRNGLKANCRDCSRAYQLNKLYGITPADYNLMVPETTGFRVNCELHHPPFTRKLFVDHIHTTGAVRGLLGSTCNQMLGKYKDDPLLCDTAASYLRATNERRLQSLSDLGMDWTRSTKTNTLSAFYCWLFTARTKTLANTGF